MQGDVRGMCVLDLWGWDGTGSLWGERSDGPTLPPAARPVSVINFYKAYFKIRASHWREGEDTEKEDRSRLRAKWFVRERQRE